MSEVVSNVSVSEGFLPKFAQEFIVRYSADSLFTRALSDLNTLALARMLEKNDKLSGYDSIALFAPEEATDCLKHLVSQCPEFKKLFFQEPLGAQPVGSIAAAVDGAFGKGTFENWRMFLEEAKYGDARACLALLS